MERITPIEKERIPSPLVGEGQGEGYKFFLCCPPFLTFPRKGGRNPIDVRLM
jgi:hypothetical protein